jgi:FlaA1/EpsC-like NDP-sugar epimerase/tetratricopeptide (TPR) repeat protein
MTMEPQNSIRLNLNRLRTAVARRDYEEAEQLFVDVERSGDSYSVPRARLQMALLVHARDSSSQAIGLLKGVAKSIDDQRASRQERSDVRALAGVAGRADFDPEVGSRFELHLELARAWQRVGRSIKAREAYASLLRDVRGETHVPAARHIAAIAEYRLAELVVDEAPHEAYEHWRRVLEMRDEEVSPYAALQMALRIGSRELVSERVERLFHYAMGTSDPHLLSEATLGLARHLKQRHQFDEARRYFKLAFQRGDGSPVAEEAADELNSLDRYAEMIAVRKVLTRPQQLLTKVRGGGPRIDSTQRVIIVGAGTGGSYLLASLDRHRYTVCGFVDDRARDVPGSEHPILGGIDDLVGIIHHHRPDRVLLAIPTLAGSRRRDVVLACRETSTPLRNLPGMYELGIGWTHAKSRASLMRQLRRVRVAETLGDCRLEVDKAATLWLQYRTALVIGAGALGAELCRRLADGEVGRLVIVDRRESALRKIQGELGATREFWAIDLRLGEAGDANFLARVFRDCAPDAIFNATGDASAAAFEPRRLGRDPDGWQSLLVNEVRVAAAAAQAAAAEQVPKLLHLSSRRAGAPDEDPLAAMKALCEQIVLWYARQSPRQDQAVVRIGPLLDSRNGRFSTMEEQIRAGAKLTIPTTGTRPRFIPTARWAELALHAARLAGSGELFEPDGGTAIDPREVAEEAIRLAGLYPDDVEIEESAGERWDEPRAPASSRPIGETELGMFVVEHPSTDDGALIAASERCARLLDARRDECVVGRREISAEAVVSSVMSACFGDRPQLLA